MAVRQTGQLTVPRGTTADIKMLRQVMQAQCPQGTTAVSASDSKQTGQLRLAVTEVEEAAADADGVGGVTTDERGVEVANDGNKRRPI